MRDPRRASAGKTLKRLRDSASELRAWGWVVEEPPDALEYVYRAQREMREDEQEKR